MKRRLQSRFQRFAALLVSLMFLCGLQVKAQDVDVTGYANVWYNITVVNGTGGQIYASPTQSGLKVWKSGQWDFKQAVPVGEIMGIKLSVFFLFAKPDEANNYMFGGWYFDDGDGKFDISKDELIGEETEYFMMTALDEGVTVYSTQSQAKAGVQPSAPMGTIFAYFTNGAKVGVTDGQDMAHAQCGTVFIDKSANSVGDVVTVRALPSDGFKFKYWKSERALGQGEVVSTANPYKFTVQGGEKLYAYFQDNEAPSVTLPAEGGFKVQKFDKPWILSDEAIANGTLILVLEKEDLVIDGGRAYLDYERLDENNEPAAQFDVTMKDNPTIIFGKGKVDFCNISKVDGYTVPYARKSDALVKWSGDKGVTVNANGELLYVYVFNEELGAFIQCGNTDTFVNPSAPSSVKVSAKKAYFSMVAQDLTDDEGNIPVAIGVSPETFDYAITGITPAEIKPITLKGKKMYNLSGVEVQSTNQKGIFIVNGKKVVVN